MVVLDMHVKGGSDKLYIDGNLHRQLLTYVKPAVMKKDFDYVICVDGGEGEGKSVFSFQLAKVLDPNFSLNNVAFTPDEFEDKILSAKKHACIIYDECHTGLSGRSSLSEANKKLVSLMMEMRALSLYCILILPTYYMLDRYCVLHRCKGLFHVYLKDGRRGYWVYYNRDRMKRLYLQGKKIYDYNAIRYLFFGRFLDQYMLNEKEYRERKRKAFREKRRFSNADSFKTQRDIILRMVHELYEGNIKRIVDLCKERGYIVDRTTVSKIVHSKNPQINQNVNSNPNIEAFKG